MMPTALVLRSLARGRGLLLSVAGLLAGFEIALVLQAASIEEAQTYRLLATVMPGVMQRWMGESVAALASFAGMVGFGYFHPIVVLIVAMVSAYFASELAGDVEAGYVDLLLARPVARHRLVTRSVVVLCAAPAVLAAVLVAATAVGVALFTPEGAARPAPRTIALMALNLVAIACCIGALALAVASGVRRRGAAFGTAALVAVALYLVNVLAASWAPAGMIDPLSPFHYFQGARILTGTFTPARDVLALAGAASALVAVAYWRFAARDL